MSADELLDRLKVVLPKYLSPEQHVELWDELRAFPSIKQFYLPEAAVDAELLQGDGWRGFVAVNVETMDRKIVPAMIISNSCDIDLTNERALLPKVLFAPLISLSAYQRQLTASGMDETRIDSQLDTIRRQEITNIFYLPDDQHGPEESIVLLDDLHTQPVRAFLDGERTRLFRLHQVSFYVFLIKLSIHFTRFHENVARFPLADAS